MSTAESQLTELMKLPEPERARIALALLDSLSGPDPYEGVSPHEFREEMTRRAEEAYDGPADGVDWETARARIVSSGKE